MLNLPSLGDVAEPGRKRLTANEVGFNRPREFESRRLRLAGDYVTIIKTRLLT